MKLQKFVVECPAYVHVWRQWLKCKIRGGGTLYIQFWAPDNGRVPFPSIITMWGGGTLWTIHWRWGNGVPLRPITL